MVHHHRQRLAAVGVGEGLRHRRPVPLRAGVERVDEALAVELDQHRGVAGGDRRLDLVDDPGGDRVGAGVAGRDVVVDLGPERRVHPRDKIGDGDVVVVLDLEKAEHVGVHRHDGVDQLRRLPLELLRRVRAARLLIVVRAGIVRAVEGAGIGVERGEVVEHVQRRDLEVAARILWRFGPRVRLDIVGRGQVDAELRLL